MTVEDVIARVPAWAGADVTTAALGGGITNMNLNPLWEQEDGERAFDYFRAVSTGPITPLVLSVTTVKDVANIGLSYKKTVFSEGEIEGFIPSFKNYVNQPEVEL